MSIMQELRGLLRLRALQLLALSSLLTLMAALAFKGHTTVRDPDIWWHLKVGDWIVEHHTVPYTGIFSRTAATHPWVAYSWTYEVLMSRAYAWFGLVGFALYGVLLTMAVTFVLFWMLHRLSGRFWTAWILALVGSFAFLFTLMPRPVFVTMILFTVMLTLLLEAQRSGRIQALYWLPLLFVVWANVHIQFLYGLFVVGLFVGINLLQRMTMWAGVHCDWLPASTLPIRGLIGILVGSLAATCIGPYTYHLYRVVRAYSNSHVPYVMIQELSAADFRLITHYVLLLLAAAAFFALGGQRKLDVFKLSLLTLASVVAFRTQRDAWFVSICAVAFIADSGPKEDRVTPVLKLPELTAVVAVVALFVFLAAANLGFNYRDLDRTISHEYPVNAVNFLRSNPVPGPLYNDLGWGGFLIWCMPQYPVVVDGRNDLYGDELDALTYNSTIGSSYTSDPYLNESGVVLLPKKLPLANLLTIDSRFRLIYQDQVAVVFVRQ